MRLSAEARAKLSAGRVGRPHGLDGSFHVVEPNPALLTTGQRLLVGSASAVIAERKGTSQRPVVRLEGVPDRAAVARLRGERLLVRREYAPELGEDEWWAEDLEGCIVRHGTRIIGTVSRLITLPSCEALEVEGGDGVPDLLVPLVADAVLAVDVERREIEVDLAFLDALHG